MQTTNREKVGKPAAAHGLRIAFADAVLITGDQSDRYARLVRRQVGPNMIAETLTNPVEPGRCPRLKHFDWPKCLADGPDLPKPRVLGEVIGSWKRHGRRRCHPCAKLGRAAGGGARGGGGGGGRGARAAGRG